jgi:hypothetical protein
MFEIPASNDKMASSLRLERRRRASIARNMRAAGRPWCEIRRVLQMEQGKIEELLSEPSNTVFSWRAARGLPARRETPAQGLPSIPH